MWTIGVADRLALPLLSCHPNLSLRYLSISPAFPPACLIAGDAETNF
jgi:hypothetical protein